MAGQSAALSCLLFHKGCFLGINRVGRKTQDLVTLIKESRAVFSSFAKAKSAKLGEEPLFSLLRSHDTRS